MPVSAPFIACAGCACQTSLWMPLCPNCQSIDDDELPPVLGERYRDVLSERAAESKE